MTAAPICDVVIVNWNSGAQLEGCIRSVLASATSKFKLGTVVVVDNASIDGSADAVSQFPDVQLITNAANLGFGRACNVGASSGAGSHIVFLNPDTVVPPMCLDQLFAVWSRTSEVAIMGPQLLDESGNISVTCSRFPSLFTVFAQAFGLEAFAAKFGKSQPMLEFDHSWSRHVDQVIGAFFVVQRQVYHELAGFDETYFMYYEEVDLCRRATDQGWTVYFCAEAVANHSGGGSSRSIPVLRLAYNIRSRLRYYRRHFGRIRFLIAAGITLLIEPLTRSAYALLEGSRGRLVHTLHAYSIVYRELARETRG